MKEIKEFFGRDCHVALTLSALLAMTMTIWACDGDGTNQDADICCDGDVRPDQDGNSEALLATLTVESTPVSGAAIELNGTPTGEVTPHSFERPVGHYTIQLTLTDYDAAPEEVDLPAEGATVSITLYPSVEGTWNLTYHNTKTGMESYRTLIFEQTGDLLIGWSDDCELTGSILVTAEISLFESGCGSVTRNIYGSRVSSDRLEGTWNASTGDSGTWWATRP